MQEVLFKLQKFANDPTGGAKTLDEVWQSIMDFAHRQHPDLTAEQAFSRELARNRKYDEVARRFGEVKKVFYGI